MNCNDFQQWLRTRDVLAKEKSPDAHEHLNRCSSSRILYQNDCLLEKQIQSAFVQQEIPAGLYGQIELTLDHAREPAWFTLPKTTGLAAGVALICFVVYSLFFTGPFHYHNLQQLSEAAVARHLDGNTTMTFTADQINQAVGMLSKELKFNVIIPDLSDKGYVLLGGRLCVLGKCKIAYLIYGKQEKISSLIIMDYDLLDFKLADGSRFSNDVKGYHTDIWKEKGQVYAMVY